MSRIHEALKKAEQERGAIPVADAILQSAVATTRIRTDTDADRPVDSDRPSPQAATATDATTEYLRFDDLLKRCRQVQWNLDPNVNAFSDSGSGTRGAEQFRTLRSRLYQLRGNQPLRTLLVTSSLPGEGKTFVGVNLAQAIIRQPDRRALLIDADLRRPRLHVPLGAPGAPGLTDYLRGEVDEMAIIQHGQEGNLCFIAGGNEVTNPSELLSNGKLKVLLDRVAPVFDWVILDSPPCLPVADASILADLCDGVLLVVRAGLTPCEVAQKAQQELQGKNIVGVVLNSVEEEHLYGSYYYGSYGYGEINGPKARRA